MYIEGSESGTLRDTSTHQKDFQVKKWTSPIWTKSLTAKHHIYFERSHVLLSRDTHSGIGKHQITVLNHSGMMRKGPIRSRK